MYISSSRDIACFASSCTRKAALKKVVRRWGNRKDGRMGVTCLVLVFLSDSKHVPADGVQQQNEISFIMYE